MFSHQAVYSEAPPHVVVAAVIRMLPELGCRLVGVDDFGSTVRFTTGSVGEQNPPPELVARVRTVANRALVSLEAGSSADASPDRLARVIDPLLTEIAVRVPHQAGEGGRRPSRGGR